VLGLREEVVDRDGRCAAVFVLDDRYDRIVSNHFGQRDRESRRLGQEDAGQWFLPE
jgi:hypothetical protein